MTHLTRSLAILVAGAGMLISTGCATKNYVRKETTPIIDKANELDELTRKNTNDIRDVDARAQQGIQSVTAKATEADQKATTARGRADQAQQLASSAAQRADVLTNTVANLDNYKPVVETSVHFGFDQAELTRKAKAALDQMISEIPNTKSYIVEVVGGTDSVGDRDYNYRLSERRASAVIQYIAEKGNVPAHKIYVIGLGKDKAVADNSSASGRARNRRVDVRLMTNTIADNNPTAAQNSAAPQNDVQR